MRTLIPVLILSVIPLGAQQTAGEGATAVTAPAGLQDYICPMDKDVRSDKPGKCPRCGMTMVLGIQDEVEYPMQLTVTPPTVRAGEDAQLLFRIEDPKNGGKNVNHYEIVHEKLFHMFVVSQDLQYFLHDHPVLQPDGTFIFHEKFPKPGMYRILGDYYPTGGTPQLVAQTIVVPGAPGQEIPLVEPKLKPELGSFHAENTDVELTMDPPEPIVGLKTLLFFHFKETEGMEKYIGAWAHMLIASDDLVDMIHDHPFIADGGPQMQFNIIFPRAHTYRIWIQFMRKGVINTVSFTVPVQELK